MIPNSYIWLGNRLQQIENQQIPSIQIQQPFNSFLQKSFQDLRIKYQILKQQHQQLKIKYQKLQEKNKKKKSVIRRKQQDLIKSFDCQYPDCKKSYASDLALNLHMKQKHNGGNKRERDLYARQVLLHQMKGIKQPQSSIQLPPNYIQQNKIRLLLMQTTNVQIKQEDD